MTMENPNPKTTERIIRHTISAGQLPHRGDVWSGPPKLIMKM